LDKGGQIPIINILFGIAALFICLFHFIYSTINYISDQLVLDIAYHGQFGVALFFVLLCIVIPLSLIRLDDTWNNWLRFFINRAVRIEPPYLVALALATINVLSHSFFLSWQKPFIILIGLLAALVSHYIIYIFIEKRPQLLSKRLTYK
jgi:peptidoglycan/LPS O-acetylase OafA/YrhL